MMFLPVRFAV